MTERAPIHRNFVRALALPLLGVGLFLTCAVSAHGVWPVALDEELELPLELPIVTTPSGEAVVVGVFQDTLDLGGGVVHTSRGGTDVFVARFDARGELLWVTVAGGPDNDVATDVDVDGQERIYVAGTFSGAATFDSSILDAGTHRQNGFVASLSDTGTWRWTRQVRSTSSLARITNLRLAIARPPITPGVPQDEEPRIFVTGGLSPRCRLVDPFVGDSYKTCDDGDIQWLSGTTIQRFLEHGSPGESCDLACDPFGVLETGDDDELHPDSADPHYRWLARVRPAGDWNWVDQPADGKAALGHSLDLEASSDGTVFWASHLLQATGGIQDGTAPGGPGHEPRIVSSDRRVERFEAADQDCPESDPTCGPSWAWEPDLDQPLRWIAVADPDPENVPAQIYMAGLRGSIDRIAEDGSVTAWSGAWPTAVGNNHRITDITALVDESHGHSLLVAGTYQSLQLTDGDGGSQSLPTTGAPRAYAARLLSDATWDWSQSAGGPWAESRGITAQGSLGFLSGIFAGNLDLGDSSLAGLSRAQFATAFNTSSGDWLVPQGVLVGQPVPPPPGAFAGKPEVVFNGRDGQEGETHLWSPATLGGSLFLLQPGTAEIRWPRSSDPADTTPVVAFAAASWPTEDCYAAMPAAPVCRQTHVAGAPADVDPASRDLTPVRVTLPAVVPSDGRLSNHRFEADTPGWSVIWYTEHPTSTDFASHPLRFQVVRTLDEAHGDVALSDELGCTIGTKLDHSWHDEDNATAAKTGYVLNAKAFYDGVGSDQAYDRARRTGAIIPVNRYSGERQADTTRAKDMAIAWYRLNANGVYWPSRAASYTCQWPDSPPTIYIASHQGTGAAGPDLDPALYPSIQIYDQPDVDLAGYNPNDEHAFFAPPNGTVGNANVVYALRSDFGSGLAGDADAASDPYVLLKYFDGNAQEWRFLVYAVEAWDGTTTFQAAGFAGSKVSAPYPLERLASCPPTFPGKTPAGELLPPFFQDHKGGLWAKSDGQTSVRYHYPLRGDFFYDENNDDVGDEEPGTCIPWLARLQGESFSTSGVNTPIDFKYTFEWPAEPKIMTVGETLLGARDGLPDIINQAAVQVIFDQAREKALDVASGTQVDPTTSLVRLVEPLQQRAVSLGELPADLAVETLPDGRKGVLGNVDGVRKMPPSIGRRLRWDPQMAFCLDDPAPEPPATCQNVGKGGLTFEGLLEDPGSGEPLLLLNVMTGSEKAVLEEMSEDTGWQGSVDRLYALSRNPEAVDMGPCVAETRSFRLFGLSQSSHYASCDPGDGQPDPELRIGLQNSDTPGYAVPFERLGSGAALTAGFAQDTGWVTLAFNNHSSLGSAPVSLEVFRVDCLTAGDPPLPSTYQGQIHVIQPENVFDEQITLRHSGDFAGRSDELHFEWYAQPDVDGTPPTPLPGEPGNGWAEITPARPAPGEPNGANEITIGGANLRTLEDTWYLARYTGLSQCGNDTVPSYFAGRPGGRPDAEAGQLAEGWVKRVIQQINPSEQKVKDYHRTPVDTTASMLSQLGRRFEGSVPLSSDPDSLNQLGLIEIYETVLRRAMALSIDATPSLSSPAGNRAILLVGTRLSDFYMLLANEAYADAQDPTLGITTDSALGSVASSLSNFQNQVGSLLEEELVLLRGRDDSQAAVTASPVYNRFFWNFTTGDGQLAYASSYNISDADTSGTIDELDAKIQFPQGHGDAWGHVTTALQKHYRLLRHPTYRWSPRTEAVSVAGSPIQVDFQDERKFAAAAASRARIGAEIVDLTYRNEYVEDVNGQWQGYKDTDPDRAWGVAGWGRRAGMAAYMDWLVGNHLLPSVDPNPDHRGIQKIDRQTVDELDEISAAYQQIQGQLDEADRGLNPLGLAKGVVPFDIDPDLVENQRQTHFEQVFGRAVSALDNAVSVWDFANLVSRQLRSNQDSTEDLQDNVRATEHDFRSRLIELYGTPYPDDIGAGMTYPVGYEGPDFYHHAYIDLAAIAGQRLDSASLGGTLKTFKASYDPMPNGLGFFPTVGEGSACATSPLSAGCTLGVPPAGVKEVNYVVWETPDFGTSLTKPPSWIGERKVTGTLQTKLQEIYRAQLALKQGIREYDNLRHEAKGAVDTILDHFAVREAQIQIANQERNEINALEAVIRSFDAAATVARSVAENFKAVGAAGSECPPKSVGFSSDLTSGLRCGIMFTSIAIGYVSDRVADGADLAARITGSAQQDVSLQAALESQILDAQIELADLKSDFDAILRQEPVLRAELLQLAQNVQQAQEAYRNELAAAESSWNQLAAFRKRTAAAVQGHRNNDLAFRVFRNDALQKYRAAFDLAARFTYLAATAYDYDTNLLGTDNRAGQKFLTDIVRERGLGQILNGAAVPGSRGLADPIGRMEANFQVLKGQMGFNNPQLETTRFSLREEHFRIPTGSDQVATEDWQSLLREHVVDDLRAMPDFQRLARPPAPDSQGPQPAVVIPFDSTVTFGLNFFGEELAAGDSAYNPSNFATRVRAVGVWLEGYEQDKLSATPQAYLIPVGADVLRSPTASDFTVREWAVVDQSLPVPFPIGGSDLNDPDWLPMADSLSGGFGRSRRFSSFRAFPLAEGDASFDASQFNTDSRLIGRSVWNRRWLLVIPGGSLLADSGAGLDCLTGAPGNRLACSGISDIKLFFQTYAYSGN